VKYWEIIADNLKKRGWSLGYVSALDCHGRFVVRADEKLTAFLELESALLMRENTASALTHEVH